MENKYWSTSDFTSACIIRASSIPLIRLEKNNRIIDFIFNSSPTTCESILRKHWDRQLILETRQLFEVISELKTRVHQELIRKP